VPKEGIVQHHRVSVHGQVDVLDEAGGVIRQAAYVFGVVVYQAVQGLAQGLVDEPPAQHLRVVPLQAQGRGQLGGLLQGSAAIAEARGDGALGEAGGQGLQVRLDGPLPPAARAAQGDGHGSSPSYP
jgi:hypothetical protein